MKYSIILPTYGRPEDVQALLHSLTQQTLKIFEIVIVDATPHEAVKMVAANYADKLPLTYIYEKGMGISESRNLGAERANGEYVVFIDSDCIVPPHYFQEVDNYLASHPADAFGGPDTAANDFSITQKAINYVMTSFLTTGGIRGRKKTLSRYELRGFNMGISRELFLRLGGYHALKVAEDIELSMRLYKTGCKVVFIEKAYVFHKRKTSLYKFYIQMYMYGKARVDLILRHREALRPAYLAPLAFLLYCLILLLTLVAKKHAFMVLISPVLAYALLILIHSAIVNKNPLIGLMSVVAFFEFLIGYGSGLIVNTINRLIFKRKEISRAAILKE